MQSERIVTFPGSNRMTPEQYAQERALLPQTKAEAGTRYEQDLAKLFYRSGWTQEELAKAEGKSQKWVDFKLRFGRFLEFSTNVLKPENGLKNLNEGRFRSYWERTDKAETNERIRFQSILTVMREEREMREARGLLPKTEITNPNAAKQLAKDMRDAFADGNWHTLEKIAKHVRLPESDVQQHLDHADGRTSATRTEKRKAGKSFAYRLFHTSRRTKTRFVAPDELRQKLDPIIKELFVEGKRNSATASPANVAVLARQLQKLLEDWIG